MWPALIKSAVSSAKVENVVNPPHRPTLRKSSICGLISTFLETETAIAPITMQPMIFIINVLIGKRVVSLTGIRPIKYLKTDPTNPPAPTASIFNILAPHYTSFNSRVSLNFSTLFSIVSMISMNFSSLCPVGSSKPQSRCSLPGI